MFLMFLQNFTVTTVCYDITAYFKYKRSWMVNFFSKLILGQQFVSTNFLKSDKNSKIKMISICMLWSLSNWDFSKNHKMIVFRNSNDFEQIQ